MKKIITSLLILVMLTSLAACAAPAAEIAASKTPVQTEAATPEPTEEPTPTPEPTPEPLTEAEKMFFIWLDSARDIKHDTYANLIATAAYRNGELDKLLEEENIADEDIDELLNYNGLFKTFYYPVSDAILSDGYNVDDLTPADLGIAILRGDSVKANGDQLEEAFYGINGYPRYEYSLISALPEESRADVYELIDIFYDSVDVKKDVSDLEETINSYNLDWRQKWYLFLEMTNFPGISPEVTYNGSKMQLGEYIYNTKYVEDFMFELQDIFAENYLADPNDTVDFFN